MTSNCKRHHRLSQGLLIGLLSMASWIVQAAPNAYYIHNDHRGAPIVMTNANKTVVWQVAYKPYGEVVPIVSSADLDIRYPGQRQDDGTGLYYNHYRDYDPKLGRYVQSDPIGLRGGVNTYAYANGNPVMHTDRYGLIAGVDDAAVVAVAATAAVGVGIVCVLTGTCEQASQACGDIAKTAWDALPVFNESRGGKNRIPDRGEPGTIGTNKPGTTKKKYGEDGIVEKEWNKGHGAGWPANEQEDHIHDHTPNPHNPNPAKPTDRGNGRPPTPEDLIDMGFKE